MPRKKRGRSTEGADDDPPADKVSVRNRPTGRLRVTGTLRQAIASNGYSCYVFNNEGAQLAELAREASDAVPSGKYGDTFRTAGEIFFTTEYIPESADATATVVHMIENGQGFALDVASTFLARAVVEQYGGVANLYVTELVPKDGCWAVAGDPDLISPRTWQGSLAPYMSKSSFVSLRRTESAARRTTRAPGRGSGFTTSSRRTPSAWRICRAARRSLLWRGKCSRARSSPPR